MKIKHETTMNKIYIHKNMIITVIRVTFFAIKN